MERCSAVQGPILAWWVAAIFISTLFLSGALSQTTRNYKFKVEYANVTRLCHTKQLVSVNGQFPGPTVKVREGDTVVVKVQNAVPHNMTIHWHGVLQVRSAWADGPAYITQCPIQSGQTFVYKFDVVQQRGTLFWHAHVSWLRATVHGAFLIYPKLPASYPFPTPAAEFPVVLGEWWNVDVESVIEESLRTGSAYNASDALTMNGQPGALYNCSLPDTEVFDVEQGKTYLLRLINAAVNFQMYVSAGNHTLTVVAADAEYTEPLTREVIVLAPGQTTDVLLTADQPTGNYFLTATVYSPPPTFGVPFPATPATAILRYAGASSDLNSSSSSPAAVVPAFPIFNDTRFVANYTTALRNYLADADVPQSVDEDLLFTFNYATLPCSDCSSIFPNIRLASSINNITFHEPRVALQQAYYGNISGVYDTDFPDVPAIQYNYTGDNLAPNSSTSIVATKVKLLDFGANVQIVFQDTRTLLFESHPIHLHGQNMFVVGEGFGNFNATAHTPAFNLRNPPARNTVGVPSGGWAAVRFKATNPGVWFMHCHFDIHTSWGMAMAFITKNGNASNETLPPPPTDLPQC